MARQSRQARINCRGANQPSDCLHVRHLSHRLHRTSVSSAERGAVADSAGYQRLLLEPVHLLRLVIPKLAPRNHRKTLVPCGLEVNHRPHGLLARSPPCSSYPRKVHVFPNRMSTKSWRRNQVAQVASESARSDRPQRQHRLTVASPGYPLADHLIRLTHNKCSLFR